MSDVTAQVSVSLDGYILMLGAGERLFDDVGALQLEQVRTIEAPGVTHITYLVLGDPPRRR